MNTAQCMRLHDAGEKALKKELEDGGFVVEATKYHEVKSLCDVIQYDFSITAIMAKSKSDQFAAHKTFDLSFYWEFKRSHRNPVDWVPFELTQFAQLYDLSHLYGVRVIYFHHSHLGLKAFQMSDLPRIREIVIPEKPGVPKETVAIYLDIADRLAREISDGSIPICKGQTFAGSNDPFLVISKEEIVDLPEAMDLIDELMADSQPRKR